MEGEFGAPRGRSCWIRGGARTGWEDDQEHGEGADGVHEGV